MAHREDWTASQHAWHGAVRSIRCSVFGLGSLFLAVLLLLQDRGPLRSASPLWFVIALDLYPLSMIVALVIYVIEGRRSPHPARGWALGLLWLNVPLVLIGAPVLLASTLV